MSKASFVGVCMSAHGGADFPKVFQAGHIKLFVSGLPAQTMNTLVKGASYEILYDIQEANIENGDPDIFNVKKAEAKKL